jgi:hypothetical protein
LQGKKTPRREVGTFDQAKSVQWFVHTCCVEWKENGQVKMIFPAYQGATMPQTRVSTGPTEKKPYTHPQLQKINPATVENASILKAIAMLNQAAEDLERTNELMRLVRDHLHDHEYDHIWDGNSSSMAGRHVPRIPI